MIEADKLVSKLHDAKVGFEREISDLEIELKKVDTDLAR